MGNLFLFCFFGMSAALLYPKDNNNKYSSWSEWSQCSASCGEGISYRYRKCKQIADIVERDVRLPRDLRKVAEETSKTTENPEDEFGFVFIQDDISGRRKKPSCENLFDKETKKCRITDCSKMETSFRCNFDHGVCNMTQDIADDLDWSLAFGEPRIYREGDGIDYNSFDSLGGYIHIDSSLPGQESSKAIIATPWLQKSESGYCIDFGYKMYGIEAESLKVLLQASENDGSIMEEEIWEKNGDHGDIWLKDSISVPVYDKNIRFVFEATVGDKILGEIALDNIAVNTNLCVPRRKTEE